MGYFKLMLDHSTEAIEPGAVRKEVVEKIAL
jgi:hypothetical protein